MAKKRRGTVYKFRDKYRAMYSAPDGSKPSKVFDDPDEADKWLTAQLSEIDKGNYISQTDMTFKEWGEMWLETYVEPSTRTSTIESYHFILKRYAKPIHHMPIAEIRPVDIQELYLKILSHGLLPSTCQKLHAVLKGLFSRAYSNQLTKRNIMESVQRPRAKQPVIKFLSPEELQTFLKASEGSTIEIMIWIAAYTGMRLGEVAALRWDDIDLNNELIKVSRSIKFTRTKGWSVSEPKTKSALRTLPIPEPLLEKLKDYKLVWKENYWNLLSIGKRGKPISSSAASVYMRETCEKTGLDVTFHGLRHSVASMLVSANMGITDVSALLGHANPTTTLNRYSHAKKDALKTTMNKVSELLQKTDNAHNPAHKK